MTNHSHSDLLGHSRVFYTNEQLSEYYFFLNIFFLCLGLTWAQGGIKIVVHRPAFYATRTDKK